MEYSVFKAKAVASHRNERAAVWQKEIMNTGSLRYSCVHGALQDTCLIISSHSNQLGLWRTATLYLYSAQGLRQQDSKNFFRLIQRILDLTDEENIQLKSQQHDGGIKDYYEFAIPTSDSKLWQAFNAVLQDISRIAPMGKLIDDIKGHFSELGLEMDLAKPMLCSRK